jgi:hypothetical protein
MRRRKQLIVSCGGGTTTTTTTTQMFAKPRHQSYDHELQRQRCVKTLTTYVGTCLEQGCQIFLSQHSKTGQNVPIHHHYIPRYTKWTKYIPNGPKIDQTLVKCTKLG